jgi:acyl-coenzyme A thioesterase PaaI-like protein
MPTAHAFDLRITTIKTRTRRESTRQARRPVSQHPGTPEGLETDGLTAVLLGREDPGQQASFAAMIEALRTLQDQITGSRPPDQLLEEAAALLTGLARELARYPADERSQIAGHLVGIAGRGQAMVPAIHIEEHTSDQARGRVTFGRFYLGGNGAVHGGAIPLAFDELMGRLANTGRAPSRTAYLHVNYRNVTPIEKRLSIEARFESEEGRKRILRGVIRDGGTVCADAEGLFVALRPGQP